MLIEIIKIEKTDRLNRTFSHELFHLKCDVCEKQWKKRGAKSRLLKALHICSNECKKEANKRGGAIDVSRSKTCMQRYGTIIPSNLPEFRERQYKTMIERYGVEFPMQMQSVQDAMKTGCMKKFGVNYPLENANVFMKAQRSRSTRVVYFHWKTQQELITIGSYERAFIQWCNANQIDFDWQIPHKMPNGRVYIIDAFIKSGEFANTWIEIKGWLTETGKRKWEWFHSENLNSQLWTLDVLKQLGIK